MRPIRLFIRHIMCLALAPHALLLALAFPALAQTPTSQAVHVGLLARRTPLPPTFSFDAVPKDEGFAGARVAIKDNSTTGAERTRNRGRPNRSLALVPFRGVQFAERYDGISRA